MEIQGPLAIGVPFTPSVGCRIDFKNVPLDALTPSSMLSRQLVFSPIKKPAELTPKRSNLSIISEEAVDISRELECYQLELENSMNEAKATKKRGNKNLMDIKQKNTFAKRLSDAIEKNVVEMPAIVENSEMIETSKVEQHSCHDSSASECPKSSTPKTPNENCIARYHLDTTLNENPDVVYEEVDETRLEIQSNDYQDKKIEENDEQEKKKHVEDDDADVFKNPAPFVRTYRRDIKRPNIPTNLQINTADQCPKDDAQTDEKTKDNEIFSGIRSSIRKSIRKLIHPNANAKSSKNANDLVAGNVSNEKNVPTTSTNILTSIRHSLRRKQPKLPLATSTPCESLNDISIIDSIQRPIFKDAAIVDKTPTNEDNGPFRAKTNLRSSFRRSSRNVMKTVFKRSIENYELDK